MVPLCLSPRIRARLAGWPWSGRTRFSPPHPATVSPMLRSSQRMSARIRSDRVIMDFECEEWDLYATAVAHLGKGPGSHSELQEFAPGQGPKVMVTVCAGLVSLSPLAVP